jgi:hypothetical protein
MRKARFLVVARFRLRAAAYGWQIRTAQPTFELLRLVLLIPSVLIALATVGLAICGAIGTSPADAVSAVRGSLPGTIAVLGFVFALFPAAVIGYLGNLARIMDVAAWSEEGAHRLRRDMEIGMSNDAAYEQLRSVYEPVVVAVNRQLGVGREFKWVDMKKREGGYERYAAIALQAQEEDRLDELLGPIKRSDHLGLRMLADSRQRLMRTWRRLNDSSSHLEDELGDNYCLRHLHVKDDGSKRAMCLDVAVASYGEIMRSSDALINEFALFAYLCGPISRR